MMNFGSLSHVKIFELEMEAQEMEWEGMVAEAAVIRSHIDFLKYKQSIGETHDYDF